MLRRDFEVFFFGTAMGFHSGMAPNGRVLQVNSQKLAE
jgi:hypothetical protein